VRQHLFATTIIIPNYTSSSTTSKDSDLDGETKDYWLASLGEGIIQIVLEDNVLWFTIRARLHTLICK
jgi:hypothetical protein